MKASETLLSDALTLSGRSPVVQAAWRLEGGVGGGGLACILKGQKVASYTHRAVNDFARTLKMYSLEKAMPNVKFGAT